MSDTSKITYTYKREDGTCFEARQRITEDPLEECPKTGQPCERVIHAPQTVVYQDEGFHSTDYDGSENPAA